MGRRDKNIASTFFRMYHKLSSPNRTNIENYEMTEKVHKMRTGARCFKNYSSFRKSKAYHLKKDG